MMFCYYCCLAAVYLIDPPAETFVAAVDPDAVVDLVLCVCFFAVAFLLMQSLWPLLLVV